MDSEDLFADGSQPPTTAATNGHHAHTNGQHTNGHHTNGTTNNTNDDHDAVDDDDETQMPGIDEVGAVEEIVDDGAAGDRCFGDEFDDANDAAIAAALHETEEATNNGDGVENGAAEHEEDRHDGEEDDAVVDGGEAAGEQPIEYGDDDEYEDEADEDDPQLAADAAAGGASTNPAAAKATKPLALNREPHSTQLPLSRIKALMKTNPDCGLAGSEATFLMCKATELFIESLSRESFAYTAEARKKTVQLRDVQRAIESVDALMFLEGALT